MTPEKIEEWFNRFVFYRHPPSREDIATWLELFAKADQPIAAKILDSTELISEADIQRGYRDALESIEGWHRRKADRMGEWVISGFGGPGESGAEMLRKFREANRLSSASFDYLFATAAELPEKQLTEDDTVVFVDDFSGTGEQIENLWGKHVELASGARSFLILTAATEGAIEKIMELEYLEELLLSRVISRDSDIFADDNPVFSEAEKERVFPYCKRADRKRPKGFGDCGLLFVLSHKTPNNSLPILHANSSSWRGLFPRYLNV